jgi:multidrug efflux system membrane fusion protein
MSLPHRLTQVAAAVSFALALGGCKQRKVQTGAARPAVPVSVTRAWRESIPVELRVVGAVEASATVQVKSQIAGQLLRAHFTEGQSVAKDLLLLEIDPRPYREALRQAEAVLARDRAQLRQAEAALARDVAQSKNAEADAGRYSELYRAGVSSTAQYDQARTSANVYRESVRATEAAIESVRATIESDRAAIDKAKLDLGYCEIRAPISGRTGDLLVHAGNLVKANDSPLVVIHQMAPIFVGFNIPEQRLGDIRRLSQDRKLAVRVWPKDDPGRAAGGHVAVIDNAVDAATGTIRLKAVFDNAGGILWPGQFVDVVLTLDTIANATVVPSEAVQTGQRGQFVYVVKPDNTVESRAVTAGQTLERKTVIEAGVAPGDTVVTDGHLRLFPGARIQAVDPRKLQSGPL